MAWSKSTGLLDRLRATAVDLVAAQAGQMVDRMKQSRTNPTDGQTSRRSEAFVRDVTDSPDASAFTPKDKSKDKANSDSEKRSHHQSNRHSDSHKHKKIEPHDPLGAFRDQLPGLTQQLLGSHFKAVNRIAGFLVPEGTLERVTDELLARAIDLAADVSQMDTVRARANVDDIADLQFGDVARSDALAQHVAEQNRVLAATEGGLTGALGLIGNVADLPLLLLLVLRTVYQTGYSYGFTLKSETGRELVLDALSRADLSGIGEKQAVLLGLGALQQVIDRGDLSDLVRMAGGTAGNAEHINRLVADTLETLNLGAGPQLLRRLLPFATGTASAIYNTRVIDRVAAAAQDTFRQARGARHQALLGHVVEFAGRAKTPLASDNKSAIETEAALITPVAEPYVDQPKSGDPILDPNLAAQLNIEPTHSIDPPSTKAPKSSPRKRTPKPKPPAEGV